MFQSFCFDHPCQVLNPSNLQLMNIWQTITLRRWDGELGPKTFFIICLWWDSIAINKLDVIVHTCWIFEPVVRPFRVTHPPCLLWGSGGFHCPQQAGSRQGMPDLGAKRCHDWQECNKGCNKFVAKVWFGYEGGKNHPSTSTWFHPDFKHFLIICFSAWELKTLTGISSRIFLLGQYCNPT